MTATLESLLNGTTAAGVFVWRGSEADPLVAALDSGWQVLAFDTTGATSRAAVYDSIATSWSLPSWFGRNLDALWDTLAERAAEPTMVVWDAPDELAAIDPDFTVTLLGVLRDAATQAGQLAVVLRPTEPAKFDPLFSELDGLL